MNTHLAVQAASDASGQQQRALLAFAQQQGSYLQSREQQQMLLERQLAQPGHLPLKGLTQQQHQQVMAEMAQRGQHPQGALVSPSFC